MNRLNSISVRFNTDERGVAAVGVALEIFTVMLITLFGCFMCVTFGAISTLNQVGVMAFLNPKPSTVVTASEVAGVLQVDEDVLTASMNTDTSPQSDKDALSGQIDRAAGLLSKKGYAWDAELLGTSRKFKTRVVVPRTKTQPNGSPTEPVSITHTAITGLSPWDGISVNSEIYITFQNQWTNEGKAPEKTLTKGACLPLTCISSKTGKVAKLPAGKGL